MSSSNDICTADGSYSDLNMETASNMMIKADVPDAIIRIDAVENAGNDSNLIELESLKSAVSNTPYVVHHSHSYSADIIPSEEAYESEPEAGVPHALSSQNISDAETFHKVGSANDVILVKHETDNTMCFNDWHVTFDRKVSLGFGSKVIITLNAAVHIFLNGQFLPNVYMRIREDGMCVFPDGTMQPPLQCRSDMRPLPGVNTLRFEVRLRDEPRVLVGECFLFNFNTSTRLVVVDIDGTITRSDIMGLFYSLGSSSGNTNHLQPGICTLLNQIADEGADILYLTSRPVVLANKTRSYLLSLRQDGLLLPLGPLITCHEKLADVVYREVITKDMHRFKGWALKCVSSVFKKAGVKSEDVVFAAGIGNRLTDALAYQEAGIPQDFICIIDSAARIQTWNPVHGLRNLQVNGTVDLPEEHVHFYESYSDPRFLSLLKNSLDPDGWARQKAWRKAAIVELASHVNSVAVAATALLHDKISIHKHKADDLNIPASLNSDENEKISSATAPEETISDINTNEVLELPDPDVY